MPSLKDVTQKIKLRLYHEIKPRVCLDNKSVVHKNEKKEKSKKKCREKIKLDKHI